MSEGQIFNLARLGNFACRRSEEMLDADHLYLKRFGRERPEVVMSVEDRARAQRAKKEARKEAKRRARAEGGDQQPPGGAP